MIRLNSDGHIEYNSLIDTYKNLLNQEVEKCLHIKYEVSADPNEMNICRIFCKDCGLYLKIDINDDRVLEWAYPTTNERDTSHTQIQNNINGSS